MEDLRKKSNSEVEKIWRYLSQVVGFIMFIAPLYLPIRAYFFESKANVPVQIKDVAIAVVGIFLWLGGKAVGTVINSLGVIIIDFLKRISNTK
jgi:hypothetical protein